MSTEDTDTTSIQETVFFDRKYRVAVFCAFAIAVPFIMFGAKQAWDSNSNRVEDWLPEGFSETQKLYWFADHFGSDELLMVSWPGCDLDDARLDRLAEALVKPSTDGAEPLFRYVFTGREALDSFMAPPLEFSRKQALGRLKGWLVGEDGHTTCAVALVSRAGVEDRHGAVAWVYRCAQSACGLGPDDIFVAGSTVDGVAIDEISEEWMMALNVEVATLRGTPAQPMAPKFIPTASRMGEVTIAAFASERSMSADTAKTSASEAIKLRTWSPLTKPSQCTPSTKSPP